MRKAHIGFSHGAAHCLLIGRCGNTIPHNEGGGYIGVPHLQLPVGLGRALRSAFFSTFFNADFSAFDCFKFLSNICNIDLMPLDFKADSFELSGCVFKPNYTVNTS